MLGLEDSRIAWNAYKQGLFGSWMLGLGQKCKNSSDKVSLFPNKVYLLRNKDALIKITSALIVFTSALMINTPALSDKANGKMENNSHPGTK